MTKILHITTVPQTLFFLAGQIAYMKDRSFDVFVASSPGELLHRFAQAEDVRSFAVEMRRRITPVRDMLTLFRLWALLREVQPQIVHGHTPKGGLLGMVAAFLAGVPVRIYHIHGLPFTTASGYKRTLLRWSERLSCLLAHHVLCVSRSNAQLAVAEGLCAERKIKVLLEGSINGVDAVNRFNPAMWASQAAHRFRFELGIPPDALVMGFVGRVVRDKGIQELSIAWQILRRELPELYMLIVGPEEHQDPVPREVLEQLRNDPRVHMMGWVENMVPLYVAMDVLALPSYREGFGAVLLEAAAMQVPVVATRIPGCVDAVDDGITGTLVPPRDARALSEAIRRYLMNAELRRRHGQAARERALRDFRPQAIWEALYHEYVGLLKQKRLPVPTKAAPEKSLAFPPARRGN